MQTIYVAEDSPIEQAVFLKALQPWQGERIVGFADGLEVYRQVMLEKPDLLILDIILPGINGMAVANLLKIQEEFQSLPILMVSSITDPDVQAQALAAGADLFVPKPINIARLREAIAQLLGASALLAS